jgi:prepilin-type processing-associated H-X9-DG protein
MSDRPRKNGAVSATERRDEQPTSTIERRSRAADDRSERRREAPEHSNRANALLTDGHDRQHEKFGGISWGSTFFGWLSAAGLTALLAGLLGATGAGLALNNVGDKAIGSKAETIGIAGGIGLLVILALAYFCGGYVAGRMARFDGARQGLGVWLWGLIAAVAVALLAVIGGSKYNLLDALNLPRIPVDSGSLTTAGLIALIASLVVTLLAGIAGGKTGERFHRKVDRFAVRP